MTDTMPATTPDVGVVTFDLGAATLARVMGNALLFAASEGGRFPLDSLRLTLADGELTVESCDRYVLFRERVVVDGSARVVCYVHRDAAATIVRNVKDAGKVYAPMMATILASPDGARFVGPFAEWSVAGGEPVTWPDTEKLRRDVAEGKATEHVTFNPLFLAKLAKVDPREGRTTAKTTGPPARFTFHGETKATRVDLGAGVDLLMMPVRP